MGIIPNSVRYYKGGTISRYCTIPYGPTVSIPLINQRILLFSKIMAELEQFCLLAKAQKGRACAALVQQVLSHKKIFHFAELLEIPSVYAVSIYNNFKQITYSIKFCLSSSKNQNLKSASNL